MNRPKRTLLLGLLMVLTLGSFTAANAHYVDYWPRRHHSDRIVIVRPEYRHHRHHIYERPEAVYAYRPYHYRHHREHPNVIIRHYR